MRSGRSVSAGVVLLLLAQALSARSGATASGTAAVTILKAETASLALPVSFSVGRAGLHAIPLAGPRPHGALSVTDNELAGTANASRQFRLRVAPTGAVLEVDLKELPARDSWIAIQVTYHQY